VILGDAAYPLTSWLITPYPTQPTPQHTVFNTTHSSARMTVERAFGKMKLQWSILHKNDMYGPQAMVSLCAACCVLHNITIDVDEENGWQPPPDQLATLLGNGDEEPPDDDVVLPGRGHPRHQPPAGKVKRNMMRAALEEEVG